MKIHFKAKTEFQQQENTTAISSVNAFSCTCCGGETWSIAAVFLQFLQSVSCIDYVCVDDEWKDCKPWFNAMVCGIDSSTDPKSIN